jgi:hypothetical protein
MKYLLIVLAVVAFSSSAAVAAGSPHQHSQNTDTVILAANPEDNYDTAFYGKTKDKDWDEVKELV